MDAELARTFLLSLPHVEETQQWGDNLVFWVGDKAVGGKMFCLIDLRARVHGVLSFAAGPERFAELVECDGLKPAPYLARAHWAAAEHWNVLRHTEWLEQLRGAHELTLAKLTRRTLAVLAMEAGQREMIVRERREQLERQSSAKKADKARKLRRQQAGA